MKTIALAPALVGAAASPALAEVVAPAPVQTISKFSVDTTIGHLLADSRNKALPDARLPGIDKAPTAIK